MYDKDPREWGSIASGAERYEGWIAIFMKIAA